MTGYSFITKHKNRFRLVWVYQTKLKAPIPGCTIFIWMDKSILKHSPTSAAIKEIFSGKSIKSALLLGQARGSLMTLGKHNPAVSAAIKQNQRMLVGTEKRKKRNDRVVSMSWALQNPCKQMPQMPRLSPCMLPTFPISMTGLLVDPV